MSRLISEGNVILAPITKKPAPGSSGKLGTGSIGKNAPSLGKVTSGSTKSFSIQPSSAKQGKPLVPERTSSFFGASSKANVLNLGEKSNKDSGKSGGFFGASGTGFSGDTHKSNKFLETRHKHDSGVKASSTNTSSSTGKIPEVSKMKTTALGSYGTPPKNLPPGPKNSHPFHSNEKTTSPMSIIGKKSNETAATQNYPSFVNPKSNKSKAGFGIIWLPSRRHNKKKNIVYNPQNYEHYKDRSPSIYNNYMSGDSPDFQPQKKKEEETLLVPDRPKVASVAVNTGITAANIDMPPESSGPTNPEEKQELIRRDTEDSKEAGGDTKTDDKDYLENNDNTANKSPETKWDKDKQSDKVDSVYLRPPPPHKARSATPSNEDEDCGIKCLYYTLQCCDCVLM